MFLALWKRWKRFTAECACESPAMWLSGYKRRAGENILEQVNKAFAYRMPCGRRRCRHDGPLTMTDLTAAGF